MVTPMAPFMTVTKTDRMALTDSPKGQFGTGLSSPVESIPTMHAKLAIATVALAVSHVQVSVHCE